MGKPYSMDLRERVVAAVETGGLSCRQAAAPAGLKYLPDCRAAAAAVRHRPEHRAGRSSVSTQGGHRCQLREVIGVNSLFFGPSRSSACRG